MPQLTVDAARVNRDAKTLCDSIGQLGTGDARVGHPELCHKLHQLVCQLVARIVARACVAKVRPDQFPEIPLVLDKTTDVRTQTSLRPG